MYDPITAGTILALILLAMGGIILTVPHFSSSHPRSRSKRLTPPLIAWGLFLLGLLLFEQRTTYDLARSPIALSKLNRIFALGAAITWSIAALVQYRRLPNFAGPLGLFLFYCLVVLTSILWSHYKLYSAFKALELTAGAIIAWLAARQLAEPKRLVYVTLWFYLFLLLATCINALLLPADALRSQGATLFEARLRSQYPIVGTSQVGHLAAVLGISVLFLALRSRLHSKAAYQLGGLFAYTGFSILVLLTQSRTALAQLLLGSVLLMWLLRRVGTLVLTTASGSIVAVLFSNELFTLVTRGSFARMEALSGRIKFWEAAWEVVSGHLITGFGFAYGTRFVVFTNALDRPETSHLHNAFMDVLVNTGLLGLLPWLGALALTLYVLFQDRQGSRSDPESVPNHFPTLLLVLSVLYLIRSLTTSVMVYHDLYTILGLSILAYAQAVYARPTLATPSGFRQQFGS